MIAITCRFKNAQPVAYHYGNGYVMRCAAWDCCRGGDPAETLELAVERWTRFHAIGRGTKTYGVVKVIEVPERMVS